MARGINKVILVGNIGADPETRYTGSGTAVTSLRVATSEQWKDKEGEKQERTEWHTVVFFSRLAEIAGEYCEKGRQVYIEGSLRTEKYTDKEGVERYSTKIMGNELQLLGGNPGHGDRASDHEDRGGNTKGQKSQQPRNDVRERARQAAAAGRQDHPPVQNGEFEEDDIPFN